MKNTVVSEEFVRTQMLLGGEAMEKLGKARVAVFGIGGVGSFAVEGLVRSGVEEFLLVDADVVCSTNLNRQLHATRKTIGKAKVDVMKERILEINPRAQVWTQKVMYTPENAEEVLEGDWDYIIDAIDTVTGKLHLIMQAKERNIPIISAMGAGNKLDPTQFEVSDIHKTSVCPLAKVMRRELKKRGVKKLKVVYSRETPITPLDLEEHCETNLVDRPENQLVIKPKRQTPGSISFVTSVMGLILAGEVVKDLIR
ncbi:tRNA threonylcarbamoyladenosine dehydratase [Alkalibacter rhizosphaerae]|uniref:tRNA threonylcarbamoyladenosine dehydratase n=1 Tax=Alkalibacter rhizosphaerae TaxID=2815577 RepID=A0A974XF56_9FIRM|nr:tRNA threonylcarbamoyladenosine dehydratase [Alkalibacter rhizosphaerae]QSX08683.1 tRNA threonylcarbamoyladenosine dehydratase [Alkalibacter rhizosphaerae]